MADNKRLRALRRHLEALRRFFFQPIHINHLAGDSGGHAGRLYDVLAGRYGHRRIVVEESELTANSSAVSEPVNRLIVIVVIGPRWLDVLTSAVMDGNDSVSTELGAALSRENAVVIPVLVGGALMPSAANLPGRLKELPLRTAVRLSDDGWHSDCSRLFEAIDNAPTPRLSPIWRAIVWATLFPLTASALWLAIRLGSLYTVSVQSWAAFEIPRFEHAGLVAGMALATGVVLYVFRDRVRRQLFPRLTRATGSFLALAMSIVVGASALPAVFVWQYGSLAAQAEDAARKGDIARIMDLFSKGWKLDQPVDRLANSMAHIAAKSCKPQVLWLLQLGGARLDRPNGEYHTATCIVTECCSDSEVTDLEDLTDIRVGAQKSECRRIGMVDCERYRNERIRLR